MNFSRQTTGAEGLALLTGAQGAVARAAGGAHDGVGLDPPRRPGHEGGGRRLRHQALDQRAAPAVDRTALGLPRHAARRDRARCPAGTSWTSAFDFSGSSGATPACSRCSTSWPGWRRPTPRCSSPGRAGPARSSSPRPSTATARRQERALRQGQPGRHLLDPLRERDVRPREGGLHRRAAATARGASSWPTGGTIFLDEIGELEPGSQVKMLRVLQDRSYEPLGSSMTRSVDVRVVSATNRDLPRARGAMASSGRTCSTG